MIKKMLFFMVGIVAIVIMVNPEFQSQVEWYAYQAKDWAMDTISWIQYKY